MKRVNKILLFCLLSLAFIGCDRATKHLAKEHLQYKEPVSYFHDTVRLEYAENNGAFLSFGDDLPKSVSFWLFSIVPLLFLCIFFIYIIRRSKKLTVTDLFLFALIFAGGLGNIIDRILFDRHVTDFMNLGINNFRTGIFNFADLYITTGVLLLLFFSFKKARSSTDQNQS